MCGIVGHTGARPSRPLLLDGLERLEYRGYDSAGVALAGPDGGVRTVRAVGNLAALRAAVREHAVAGAPEGGEARSGIGHTRWATHGRPSVANAHPHTDTLGRIHIVLNGIVENHLVLRAELEAQGAVFSSQTDAEVVAHLIAHADRMDLAEGVQAALGRLEGHYAFVALSVDHPGLLVATRKECPLVVGVGDGEAFVASAGLALPQDEVQLLDVADGGLVELTAGGVAGHGALSVAMPVELRQSAPEKDGFETFMAKEMAEQPEAVGRTVFERLGPDGVELDLGVDDATLAGLRSLRIVACGTSYHAGLVARAMIEEWAQLPVEVEVASEHRARTPLTGPGDLLLGISQSGETADTLAAMRLARSRGATVLALTNVRGSQVTREADGVLFTEAGTEVGVAATKTFTAQVAALALLALRLAEARGTLPEPEAAAIADDLRRLPDLIERALVAAEPWAQRAAGALAEAPLVMFLGRHAGTAVAQEGALKLKEVAYVPCDAYAAGEMKHGPIALLAPGTPVVCVATDAPMLEKLLSNMAEVRARGAQVLAVVTEGDDRPEPYADDVVAVPPVRWELQPLLAVLPLQRLAHDVAAARGLNVDQPRNLAKTVTVE